MPILANRVGPVNVSTLLRSCASTTGELVILDRASRISWNSPGTLLKSHDQPLLGDQTSNSGLREAIIRLISS